MTPAELREALQHPSSLVDQLLGLYQTEQELGLEGVLADVEVEQTMARRRMSIIEAIVPAMKAGAVTWDEVHDALTDEQHATIQAVIDESR